MIGVRILRGVVICILATLVFAVMYIFSNHRMIPADVQVTAFQALDGSLTPFFSISNSSTIPAVAGPTPAKPANETAATALLPSAAPSNARRPNLTVVCVSDTHGLYQDESLIQVPEGDMLLFPGDVEVSSAAAGLAFSRWLEALPVRGPRVVTWGNMDVATPGLTNPVPGAIVLVNTIQEISGYRIFGSPLTPLFSGAYQHNLGDEDSYSLWSGLLPPHADVDIIMTHGPPYGIGDMTRGRHRGDKGLLRAVQALHKAPLLWVCGHIHEQYGEHRVPHPSAPGGSFLLINSAVYYVQNPGHERTAQPRAVLLPEVRVVSVGGQLRVGG